MIIIIIVIINLSYYFFYRSRYGISFGRVSIFGKMVLTRKNRAKSFTYACSLLPFLLSWLISSILIPFF